MTPARSCSTTSRAGRGSACWPPRTGRQSSSSWTRPARPSTNSRSEPRPTGECTGAARDRWLGRQASNLPTEHLQEPSQERDGNELRHSGEVEFKPPVVAPVVADAGLAELLAAWPTHAQPLQAGILA